MDISVGHLEVVEEDGTVLGPSAVDQGQLLGLLGLGAAAGDLVSAVTIGFITLLLVSGEGVVELAQIEDFDDLYRG